MPVLARTATSRVASSARPNGTPHFLRRERFHAFACPSHP
ncbi:hypothetical protein BURMUCGD1_5067 [Burkholderia multivorans CGD1]|nr:hypothetical protein BURMUCGD1_5067 [Burkholderia multivorans CGD1]